MAKLKLIAAPTFTAKVGIPVAGSEPVEMEFTFRHRTKTALAEFNKDLAGKDDAVAFMEMVTAWNFEEEFNKESVELLLENFMGSALAVYDAYKKELTAARTKN